MNTVVPIDFDRTDQAVISARRDLAAALRWAARLNMNESIHNHFTLAVPGAKDRYLINPNTRHWREVTAGDLCVVDGAGNLISGNAEVSRSAFSIHGAIHTKRPDARCVLHTHMPYATAFTMIDGWRLEYTHQSACRFYGRVAYDDDTGFNGLALYESEAERMANALGSGRLLFLSNHGVIVAGENVAEAFEDLYYLEKFAQLHFIAVSAGRSLRVIPETVVAHTEEQLNKLKAKTSVFHFEALKRMLEREEPDYASL